MTARFTLDPPLASADTWAGRRAAIKLITAEEAERKRAYEARAREAQIEAIFRGNRARRDQAAKDYGEPENDHEFYHGRPGSQAERIVCNCLRALQKLPEIDRLYADQLMDSIAAVYLDSGWAPRQSLDDKTRTRRITALLRIAGEKDEQSS